MYIPNAFRETDIATLHSFIEKHSFATLISHREIEPLASHLPLLLSRTAGVNGRLIGHMAQPNPQWQSAAGQRVLAIFAGPHAYISPTWYEARNVVPTWNYVAVHVYGVLRLVEDSERVHEVLERTVELYESKMEQPWLIEAPEPDFIEKLQGGIVGFEIDIDRIEGQWKLNQNHPAERRQRVIRGLESLGEHDADQIAALMTALES